MEFEFTAQTRAVSIYGDAHEIRKNIVGSLAFEL